MIKLFMMLLVSIFLIVTCGTFLFRTFDENYLSAIMFLFLIFFACAFGSTFSTFTLSIMILISCVWFMGDSVIDAYRGFSTLLLAAIIGVLISIAELNIGMFAFSLISCIYLSFKISDLGDLV